MYRVIKIGLLLVSVMLVSCATSNKVDLREISKSSNEELSGKVELVFNIDSTYVICIGNKKKMSQAYSFYVYSIRKKSKVTQVYNNVDFVKWDGVQRVKFSYLAGIVKYGDENPSFRTIEIED